VVVLHQQRIYITKICKAYLDDNREFPPLKDHVEYDPQKARWFTDFYSIEEVVKLIGDCIISPPGGDLEFGSNVYKRFKNDWLVIIYNNYFE
jgi:hypothetical protein